MKIRSLGRRLLLLLLITGMPFFLFGFDFSFLYLSTPIKSILDNPREYEGNTIAISGDVTDVYSFFVIKSFALRDKTGEIIVITERILPKKGASIKVKGRVIDAFSFGDKSITAFKELQE